MFVEPKKNGIEPIRKGKTQSYKHVREPTRKMHVFIHMICQPRKSKDKTLTISSTESFTPMILKTILCLLLDFQGKCIDCIYSIRL